MSDRAHGLRHEATLAIQLAIQAMEEEDCASQKLVAATEVAKARSVARELAWVKARVVLKEIQQK